MRITGGVHRGRQVHAPAGTATRPTADRVREALFSRLDAVLGGCEGTVVLDAYAGSGALGLEAISRGAFSATFVERSAPALKALRRNIDELGVSQTCAIVPTTLDRAVRGGALHGEAFTLLFLDPPYRINKFEVRVLIETLCKDMRLAPDAVVVWEHAVGSAADWPLRFESVGSRRYGSTEVDMAVYRTGGQNG